MVYLFQQWRLIPSICKNDQKAAWGAACIWVPSASSRCGDGVREPVFEFEFKFEFELKLKLCGSHAPFQVADLVERRRIITQFILEPIGHIGIGCVALQRWQGGLRWGDGEDSRGIMGVWGIGLGLCLGLVDLRPMCRWGTRSSWRSLRYVIQLR